MKITVGSQVDVMNERYVINENNRIKRKDYMVNLNGSVMYEMRKDEFIVLYDLIIAKMNEMEHTMDYIVYSIANVTRHGATLSKLNQKQHAMEKTKQIVEASKAIHKNMVGLVKSVEYLIQLSDESEKEYARSLYYWLKPERKKLLSRNQSLQIQSMKTLEELKALDDCISEGLGLFGLNRLYENALGALQELCELRKVRNSIWAESNGLGAGLYNQIASDMQILFVGLEGMARVSNESQKEYQKLCNEIKKLLVSAGAAVKSRATRRENEKLENKDVDVSPVVGEKD